MGTNSVRVLGRKYRVTRKPDAVNYGLCDTEAGTINVRPDLAGFKERDIMLHEVLHAILAQQGTNHSYKLEESFVRPLATGIIAVLQDNPQLAAWLIAPIKES